MCEASIREEDTSGAEPTDEKSADESASNNQMVERFEPTKKNNDDDGDAMPLLRRPKFILKFPPKCALPGVKFLDMKKKEYFPE